MDFTDTNCIDTLFPFLENKTLCHIIKHFNNKSNDTLLIIKEASWYKCPTDKEKSQYVKEKFKRCIDSDFYYINNYGLKNKFKTVIFICIFAENTSKYKKLLSNLPKPDVCIFNSNFWSSENSISNTLFMEDVKNLISIVYIKPAKRN